MKVGAKGQALDCVVSGCGMPGMMTGFGETRLVLQGAPGEQGGREWRQGCGSVLWCTASGVCVEE